MRFLEYPACGPMILNRFAQKELHQPEVERSVERIIAAVRKRGDRAVLEFTRRFDRVALSR